MLIQRRIIWLKYAADDQLVTLADMMAKTFGHSNCPSVASERGVSVSLQPVLTASQLMVISTITGNPNGIVRADRLHLHCESHGTTVGFRANLAQAQGSAVFVVLHGAEGIALCFPPGTLPESKGKGGQFVQDNRKALQSDAGHLEYLHNEVCFRIFFFLMI